MELRELMVYLCVVWSIESLLDKDKHHNSPLESLRHRFEPNAETIRQCIEVLTTPASAEANNAF